MYVLIVKDERGALVAEQPIGDSELVIGRLEHCDIHIDRSAISRQHACFYVENEQVYVSDMGSANGIYVDERRINRDQAVNPSSHIRIADFLFVIEKHEPSGAGSGIRTASVERDAAHGKLTILTGSESGREIYLFEPYLNVGRTEENEVCIQDPSISRQHARLKLLDDGSYALQDLQSSNGVYVQGRRIARPARVSHGDRITFGQIECVIASANQGETPHKPQAQVRLFLICAVAAIALVAIVSWLSIR